MYFKITDKESETYKKLYELRSEELKMEADNEAAVKKLIGDDWTTFLGYPGQQNFGRVTLYEGFEFKHPENLPPKTWKLDKKHGDKGIYVPDSRTKHGREIKEALNNLPTSSVKKVFSILGCELSGRFTFPYVEICKDGAIVFLMSDRYSKDIRKFPEIVEITGREFDELRGYKEDNE